MGNRAVITTEDKKLGVYLHWHGGRDSVEAFLLYCKLKGYRAPEGDCYGWARLCQVIGNFFGGELSLGIDRYDVLDTDNGDNGVYIIKDWQIVGREYAPSYEQESYGLDDLLIGINNSQPASEQLNESEMLEEAHKLIQSPITNKQIRAIHAVINELKISDNRYRCILMSVFQVKTCKDLTERQASALIEMLNKIK